MTKEKKRIAEKIIKKWKWPAEAALSFVEMFDDDGVLKPEFENEKAVEKHVQEIKGIPEI